MMLERQNAPGKSQPSGKPLSLRDEPRPPVMLNYILVRHLSGNPTYQALTFKMYFVTSTIYQRVIKTLRHLVRNLSDNLSLAPECLVGSRSED
jgi:hypothetical protein